MNNFLLDRKYLDDEAKLLNPYNLEAEPADGDRAIITGLVDAKRIDEDQRTVSGMASTESIDRYEEIIEASAFTPWLDTFMRNPQFLAGHKMVGFDAAEPTNIGQWTDLRVERGVGLAGTAQFLAAGDPLADKYWTRYQQRSMRAFSVGVIVHEWAMREFEVDAGVTKRIRVLTNVELVEISAVTVPANRQALVRAAGLATREPEKSADSFDIQALAKALAAELIGPLNDNQKQNLIKLLNAEPGTPMFRALERIAESWDLVSGYDHEHDDAPSAAGDPSGNKSGHPAVQYMTGA